MKQLNLISMRDDNVYYKVEFKGSLVGIEIESSNEFNRTLGDTIKQVKKLLKQKDLELGYIGVESKSYRNGSSRNDEVVTSLFLEVYETPFKEIEHYEDLAKAIIKEIYNIKED